MTNAKTSKSPATAGGEASGRAGSNYLLASLLTSIVLLGTLVLYYVLGPGLGVWPGYLGLILAAALAVNLGACIYDRRSTSRQRYGFAKTLFPTRSIMLTQDIVDARIEVRRVLREELGLMLVTKDPDWVVMEKGSFEGPISLVYYASVIVCLVAVLLTYALAYGGTVTLWPDRPDTIEPAEGGRLSRMLGKAPEETPWSLVLDKVSTVYKYTSDADGSDAKNPDGTLKDTGSSIEYRLKELNSSFRVIDNNKSVRSGTAGLGRPIRYGGYAFYPSGLVQNLQIRVDNGFLPVEAETNTDVFLPGVEPPLRFGAFIAGPVELPDGTTRETVPKTVVSRVVSQGGDKRYSRIDTLSLDTGLVVGGRLLTIVGHTDGVVLTYRYDPARWVFLVSGILVIVLMGARLSRTSHRLAYNLEEVDGIATLRLCVEAEGLRADVGRLVNDLEEHLTRDDLRPDPVD